MVLFIWQSIMTNETLMLALWDYNKNKMTELFCNKYETMHREFVWIQFTVEKVCYLFENYFVTLIEDFKFQMSTATNLCNNVHFEETN